MPKTELIRDWYLETYPEDELGQELANDITFEDAYDLLNSYQYNYFYDYVAVNDSLIRERIFDKLAELYNKDYQDIYDLWVRVEADISPYEESRSTNKYTYETLEREYYVHNTKLGKSVNLFQLAKATFIMRGIPYPSWGVVCKAKQIFDDRFKKDPDFGVYGDNVTLYGDNEKPHKKKLGITLNNSVEVDKALSDVEALMEDIVEKLMEDNKEHQVYKV